MKMKYLELEETNIDLRFLLALILPGVGKI